MRARWVLISLFCGSPAAVLFTGEEGEEEGGARARRDVAWQERSAEIVRARARIARREAERWADRLPDPRRARAAVPGESWINLGPSAITGRPDAGRVTGIAVDPRDPNVVYVATSGGGVWKTWDFETAFPDPTWHPLTEDLPNLAIGAMTMSATDPDTIFIGFGDAFDVAGDSIAKSTDGGMTWTIVQLGGTGAAGIALTPLSFRELVATGSTVFAATDVGLFRSIDGGASYSLIDLPNAGPVQVAEATWSIVQAGTNWVATGVYACDAGWVPPWAGAGVLPGAVSRMKQDTVCPYGNPGDIWISSDGGASWTSRRAVSGALPSFNADDIGPMIASASGNAVYVLVGTGNEATSRTRGVWRSLDGGEHFTNVGGTVVNPTSGSSPDCVDLNVAHDQAWYDLAIIVDPENADHVLIGGNYCGVRSLNATGGSPRWENVAHWSPDSGRAETSAGRLPYVHADWHLIRMTSSRVFVGGDGGLFSSSNVFSPATQPTSVSWRIHNRGMPTHLVTGVGSGDPADGNYRVVIAGLQDNGVLYREPAGDPTMFRKIMGADGFDAAINKGTAGEFYLASQYHTHYLCIASWYDCADSNSWQSFEPPIPSGDEFPFVTRIAAVQPNPTGSVFMTVSKNAVWRSDITDPSNPVWYNIGTFDDVRNVFASQNIRRLYGAVLAQGRFAVTSDAGATWTTSSMIGLAGTATVARASSIAFPTTTPPGKNPGDVYLAASSAWTLGDRGELVPDEVGHLFLTEDRGATFVPFHGDLPNVPIQVVRYDPGDDTNQTIYVATELGLYRTADGGTTWTRFGYGLPMVRVTDLFIAKNSSMIRIGTYGRGVWEIYVSAPKGVQGNGDFDRNTLIDWRDVGAVASRIGTTPQTTGWPAYLWIDDLVGGTAEIDQSDLDLVLDKLGGHP